MITHLSPASGPGPSVPVLIPGKCVCWGGRGMPATGQVIATKAATVHSKRLTSPPTHILSLISRVNFYYTLARCFKCAYIIFP